jgi:adenylate kinase family enzyme
MARAAMKRVLLIGSGGAGKSTLARRLGEATGIEVIHLDVLHWRPNWTVPPKDEWEKLVAEAVAKESWIMDGNFGGTMEKRLAACDTVVFLDFPRTVCLYRVLKRRLTYNGTNRPDMAEGCHEKIDLEFLHWVWTFPESAKPKIEEKLKRYGNEKTVIRLRSKREVEDFLTNLGNLE